MENTRNDPKRSVIRTKNTRNHPKTRGFIEPNSPRTTDFIQGFACGANCGRLRRPKLISLSISSNEEGRQKKTGPARAVTFSPAPVIRRIRR